MGHTRRTIVRAGICISAAALVKSSRGNSQEPFQSGDDQNKYLFWIGNRVRDNAKLAADNIAGHLDYESDGWAEKANIIYESASPQLHNRLTSDNFSKRLIQSRGQFGPVIERAFQGLEGGFRMLPGLSNGYYLIVIYDLLVSNGILLTEQYTLASKDGNDRWILVGYFSGPKPYYRY